MGLQCCSKNETVQSKMLKIFFIFYSLSLLSTNSQLSNSLSILSLSLSLIPLWRWLFGGSALPILWFVDCNMWVFDGSSVQWVSVVSDVGCNAGGCGLQVRDGRFQFIGRPQLCPWVLWVGVLAGGIVLILFV